MTADRRDQLAEALPEALGPVGLRRRAIPELDVEGSVTGDGVVLLDALLPVVDRLIREAQADALAPFEELFSGGPDTSCRTIWRGEDGLVGTALPPRMECVEVPMADLRDAFDRAAALRGVADPSSEGAEGTGTGSTMCT